MEERQGREIRNAGVLDRTDDGRIVFPYEAVKVEVGLEVAYVIFAKRGPLECVAH